MVYAYLVKKDHKTNNALSKWQTELQTDLSGIWSFYCNVPFRCTSDVKLRWFQYKIINRIFPTNSLLLKMNLTDNNKCSFCEGSIESIEHLFFSCPCVQSLWRYVKGTLDDKGIKIFPADCITILFGMKGDQTFNLILILIKYYIFLCKVNKTKLSVMHLKVFLKKYFDLQKFIAISILNSEMWERYWLPWYNVFGL